MGNCFAPSKPNIYPKEPKPTDILKSSDIIENDPNIKRMNTEILAIKRENIEKGLLTDVQNSLVKDIENLMARPIKDFLQTPHKYLLINSVIVTTEQHGFDNKQIKSIAEGYDSSELGLQNLGIAYSCKKGVKPSPNQDDFFILIDGEMKIFGVMDGHGIYGHFCSDFVKQLLPKLILSNPNLKLNVELALTQSFLKVNDALVAISTKTGKFSSSLSGTTATVVIQKNNNLYVAHVGDSRSVMSVSEKSGGYKVVDLTRDHSPNLEDEKTRIIQNGGDVRKDKDRGPYRVFARGGNYPGLAMSRAIGDTASKEFGIISDPEIKVIKLESNEEFFLLCSDGVWEFLSSKDVIEFVHSKGGYHQLSSTCEKIAEKSFNLWLDREGYTTDDITCLLIYLK